MRVLNRPALTARRAVTPWQCRRSEAAALGTVRELVGRSNHLTCPRDCGLVTAAAEGRRVRLLPWWSRSTRAATERPALWVQTTANADRPEDVVAQPQVPAALIPV